jgi:L-fuculose-phosphate aldolase
MHDAGDVLSTASALHELMRDGKKMVARELVSAHAGNSSTRLGKSLLISRHGRMLDALEGQIVQVALDPPRALDHLASPELPMHRAIYRQTEPMAVCHGHGRFSILESLRTEAAHVTPTDSESVSYLPVIPIVEAPSGSEELGRATALALHGLQAMALAFANPVAPGQDEPRADRGQVLLCGVNTCDLLPSLPVIGWAVVAPPLPSLQPSRRPLGPALPPPAPP